MLNISLDLTDKFKRKKLMENNCWGKIQTYSQRFKTINFGGWAFLRGFSYIETTHLADSNVTSIRLKAKTMAILLETCDRCDRCDPAE
jgi:hypothetical protein